MASSSRAKPLHPTWSLNPKTPTLNLQPYTVLNLRPRTVYVSANDGEGWLYGYFLDPEARSSFSHL